MATKLTGDSALALLGNTVATGAMLYVLITLFGPISGAHFNPVVSLMFALRREFCPQHGLELWHSSDPRRPCGDIAGARHVRAAA